MSEEVSASDASLSGGGVVVSSGLTPSGVLLAEEIRAGRGGCPMF
jgi:hypothetical protein